MNRTTFKYLAIIFVATLTQIGFAQDAGHDKDKVETAVKVDKPESKFYKLDFLLKEVDGTRVVNSRSYSTYAATDAPPSMIRANIRMQDGREWGIRIDARDLRQMQNQLGLNLSTDISGLPQESTTEAPRPILRQYTWSSKVLLPVRKPTIVFSSDSTSSKTQMQVELTATPIP
jgi:hypothetical protein